MSYAFRQCQGKIWDSTQQAWVDAWGGSTPTPTPTGLVYGVQWAGSTSSTWTRTDASALFTDPTPAVNNGNGSSPFDDIWPWSGMQRVEDAEGGTLVRIPKFYYKWTRSYTTMTLQITDTPTTGFYTSPAHADRGDGKGERDYVYVGAYHCGPNYKSVSGKTPNKGVIRPNCRTNIHSLGSTIWQWDYAMYWTICMLYLVEYADWDSQTKIGLGAGIGNNGQTDAMVYHTGTNVANRTTSGHVRYRYIEDLWSGCFDYVDGIYFIGRNVYVTTNPSSFSDSTGGTYVGSRQTTGGFISSYSSNPSTSGFEWAIFPNLLNGSGSTYVCDYNHNESTGVTVEQGANQYVTDVGGLFCLYCGAAASTVDDTVGSRLMKLP